MLSCQGQKDTRISQVQGYLHVLPDLVRSPLLSSDLVFSVSPSSRLLLAIPNTQQMVRVLLSKSQPLGGSPARRSFSPFALASQVTSAFWRRVCFCTFPPLIGLNDFRARIKTRRSRLAPLKLVTWESIFKTSLKLEVCPPEML